MLGCVDEHRGWVPSPFWLRNSETGSPMAINITISRTVPHDAFARIEALTNQLRQTDPNFQEVPIEVNVGDLVDGVSVSDREDYLRGELLRHLVEEALRSDSDSIMSGLANGDSVAQLSRTDALRPAGG